MFFTSKVETRELDEKLKHDDSESDQSEKSKIPSSSPTTPSGRGESSSGRNDSKKDDKPITVQEAKSEDIEEVNYKEMLNRSVFYRTFDRFSRNFINKNKHSNQ